MYNQIVKFVSIPFYGEPLKGLQIMGMLETRTLDFDNIIMLSVNEDFIPAGKSDNSFIPFDIKREFKLPTYRERNAVFAYHFYRILQRAENIYLLYNTETGDLGGGDKSRFITQLQYEMAKYNPKTGRFPRDQTGAANLPASSGQTHGNWPHYRQSCERAAWGDLAGQ